MYQYRRLAASNLLSAGVGMKKTSKKYGA